MSILPMAARCPHVLETEREEQLLEIAKRDRRAWIGEQVRVELVDAGHGLSTSMRCQSSSCGRWTNQNLQPFTLVREIALAASDGLVLRLPNSSTHWEF